MYCAGVPGLEPRHAEPNQQGCQLPHTPIGTGLFGPEEKDNLKIPFRITWNLEGGLNPLQTLGGSEELHGFEEGWRDMAASHGNSDCTKGDAGLEA